MCKLLVFATHATCITCPIHHDLILIKYHTVSTYRGIMRVHWQQLMALLISYVSQQRAIVMDTAVLLYNNHAATLVIKRTQINHNASLNISTTLSLFIGEQRGGFQVYTIYFYSVKHILSWNMVCLSLVHLTVCFTSILLAWCGYLNFSTWFMKNKLLEQRQNSEINGILWKMLMS